MTTGSLVTCLRGNFPGIGRIDELSPSRDMALVSWSDGSNDLLPTADLRVLIP